MIEDEPCNQPDGDEQGEDQTSDQPPTRRTIRRRHVLNVGGLRRALFELGGHGTPRLRPRYLGCLNGADCTAPLHSSFSDATAPAVETSAMHVLLPDLVRGCQPRHALLAARSDQRAMSVRAPDSAWRGDSA